MNHEINLRGHHISAFTDYLFFRKFDLSPDFDERDLKAGYSIEFLENKRKIFDWLYSNPDAKIRIVENSIDALCIACSKPNQVINSKPACIINESSDCDRINANQSGFKIGIVYSASEFINYINKSIDGLDNLILRTSDSKPF